MRVIGRLAIDRQAALAELLFRAESGGSSPEQWYVGGTKAVTKCN